MPNEYRVRLPKPHARQIPFLRSKAKRIMVRAGRRSGKTTAAAIRAVECFVRGGRVLYATPTADQLDAFWYVVTKALSDPIRAGVFVKNEVDHTIELLDTRQRTRARTAWNADMLRGDYADLLILDEYQLMDETVWKEVGLPMLLDKNGAALILYTPPSLHSRSASKASDPRHASKLFKTFQRDASGRSAVFHFASHDNPHISREALDEIGKDMSRLAYRQEIEAEDIDEIPGALWTRAMIDASRVTEYPALERVVVAIDPSVSSGERSDEAGILVGGIGDDDHGYLLKDLSRRDSPMGWATVAIAAYHQFQADCIVAEVNNGGDMVEQILRTIDPNVSFEAVTATRGKIVRAEPICALYEQCRIHHVNYFEELEAEMSSYVPGRPSPNRMDAMVWLFTQLMLDESQSFHMEIWG